MQLSKLRKAITQAQTPEEEDQLKSLGWSDMDIEKMTVKQVDLILKKKTRNPRKR